MLTILKKSLLNRPCKLAAELAIASYMDTLNSPARLPLPNPFLQFQSRYLILGTFLIASPVVSGLYAILGEWQLLPLPNEDPISTPVLTITLLTVMGLAILWVSRCESLSVRYLFGQRVLKVSIVHSVLLVASLLLFSLGISSIGFYLLSLVFPEYVAQVLESNMLMMGAQSLYPRLYQGLMLFLLVVYAPLVEELIFRGILLQRWSVKWGLRRGLVASSVLFGALHLNNPMGLTLFGLVMGLLYVRTCSLWVPIACHALNNLAAVGIDGLSKIATGGQTSTVSDVQDVWIVSLLLIAVSFPFLGWFIWHSWPRRKDQIPYLLNVGVAQGDLQTDAMQDKVDRLL